MYVSCCIAHSRDSCYAGSQRLVSESASCRVRPVEANLGIEKDQFNKYYQLHDLTDQLLKPFDRHSHHRPVSSLSLLDRSTSTPICVQIYEFPSLLLLWIHQPQIIPQQHSRHDLMQLEHSDIPAQTASLSRAEQ